MTAVVELAFDSEGFYRALAATVAARKLKWKQVALKQVLARTTLTRMAQRTKAGFGGWQFLPRWAGLPIQDFVRTSNKLRRPETAAKAYRSLRADPDLDEHAKRALETVVLAAYEQFKNRSKK